MPTLGLAAAVLSVVAASALASLLASPRSIASPALVFAACWPSLDLWIEATQYVARNAYADYRIVEIDDDKRILVVNNQAASRHGPAGEGWHYVELLEQTMCAAGENRVLVLGAAGMSFGRNSPCELALTFVDIDPAQESISAQFLDLAEESAAELVIEDARSFLRNTDARWNAILIDVFTNPRVVPNHLLTKEFYFLARSRLIDDGSLYVNFAAYPNESLFLSRAGRTLRSVFAACSSRSSDHDRLIPWHDESSFDRNLVLRCTKGPHDGDRTIYSDSVSRADLDRSLRLHQSSKQQTMFTEGDNTHE